jgi:hypothetical protein
MPGRGPQTFKKRQKEQQRKEKQQEKMARRLTRKDESSSLATAEQENITDSPVQDVQAEVSETGAGAPLNDVTVNTPPR